MNIEYLLPIFFYFPKIGGLQVAELNTWHESRIIECIYCLDYDRSHISLMSCRTMRPRTCLGNACFMRFHKDLISPQVMYISGCLNLTNSEVSSIAKAQHESKEIINDMDGTLLCESTRKTGTCICSNIDLCNIVDLSQRFTEYNETEIFKNVTVNEINHIKYFLPQEYQKFQKIPHRRNSKTLDIISPLILLILIVLLDIIA